MTFRTKYFLIALASLTLSVTACNKTPAEPPKPVVDSIAVKVNTAPTEFTVGDTFSVTGGKLVVTYSDTTTKEVNMTLDMIPTKPDMTAEHLNYTVNVVYESKQTSYVINVKNPVVAVTSIAVKANTAPTEFKVGDTFSVNGGKLDVRYSNNTRAEIDMTLAMIKNAPDMSQAHADYEVQVEYEGARTTYVIQVTQGDTRAEVTIGVDYVYNGNESVTITDDTQILTFYQGRSYKFYYGADPAAAKDSIGFKFFTRGDNPQDLGTEYPTAIGEYEYHVYIAEGDADYKPVQRVIKFDIKVAPSVDVVLNHENAPTLSETAGDAVNKIQNVNFAYHNAKAHATAALTLVKQAATGNPDKDDNYIEISDPVAFKSNLAVSFEGENNYVMVYASANGEEFFLVDTLTVAKQETDRARNYFYVRLVGAPVGHSEIDINSVSFTYEVDGAPVSAVARREASDGIHSANSDEENVYFVKNDKVFLDNDRSNLSIGIRLKECSVNIQFGTTLKEAEIKNYALEFYVRPTDNATYQQARDDATVSSTVGVYAKPTSEGRTTVGAHKKVVDGIITPSADNPASWTKVTIDIVTMFDDGLKGDIKGMNVWLNRYCTTGFVLFDDFRLVQKDSYPHENRLDYIVAEGMTTDFNQNDIYSFDGTVKAYYTDWSSKTVDNADLEIEAPDMTTSGEKNVKISYTDNEVKKSITFKINVAPSGNPKEEETQTIVAEANDLAKAANFLKENSAAKGEDNTDITYGNSTNSLAVSGLKGQDDAGGFFIVLPTPLEGVTQLKVKFFMKNNDHAFYARFTSSDYSKKGSVKPSFSKFTQTPAGNNWTMYEYTYDVSDLTNAGKNIGRLQIRLTGSAEKLVDGEHVYFDGIEITTVA